MLGKKFYAIIFSLDGKGGFCYSILTLFKQRVIYLQIKLK